MQRPQGEELLCDWRLFQARLPTLLGTLVPVEQKKKMIQMVFRGFRGSEALCTQRIRALREMPHPLWKEERMPRPTWVRSQKCQDELLYVSPCLGDLNFYPFSELSFLIGWRKTKTPPRGAWWVKENGGVGEEGEGALLKGRWIGGPAYSTSIQKFRKIEF